MKRCDPLVSFPLTQGLPPWVCAELCPLLAGTLPLATPHALVATHPLLPQLSDINLAVVRSWPSGGLGELLAEVEPVLDLALVPHRRLLFPHGVDSEDAREELLGDRWRAERLLVMTRAGTTAAPPGSPSLRQVHTPADMAVLDRLDAEALLGSPGNTRQARFMLTSRRRELTQLLHMRWWLGESGGSVASCAGTFHFQGGVSLQEIQVRPAFRRRGHGRALVGELCRRADEEGTPWISLMVEEVNEGARALYEGLGFEEAAALTTWSRSVT